MVLLLVGIQFTVILFDEFEVNHLRRDEAKWTILCDDSSIFIG